MTTFQMSMKSLSLVQMRRKREKKSMNEKEMHSYEEKLNIEYT